MKSNKTESVLTPGGKLDELKKKIETIKREYDPSAEIPKPTAPKIDTPDLSYEERYKTAESITDEELGARAEAELEAEARAERDKIAVKADNDAKTLSEAERAAKEEYERLAAETGGFYDEARKHSSDSALKRGLARSSVAQLSQDKLNEEEAAERAELSRTLGKTLADYDRELNEISARREEALKDYDIRYAAELTKKLNGLKADRDKKQSEVLEYNNALKERLTKLAMEQSEWAQKYESDAIDLEAKQKEREETIRKERETQRSEAVFREVSAFLSGLSREEAKRLWNDSGFFKAELNPYHYALLNNAFNAKLATH